MTIKKLKTQFKSLNKTQQKFVMYVMIIKISILLAGIALLILVWKYVMQ